MDCDSCGRYRPTAQVHAVADPAGRLRMLCGRCRGRLASRRASPLQGAPAGRSDRMDLPIPMIG